MLTPRHHVPFQWCRDLMVRSTLWTRLSTKTFLRKGMVKLLSTNTLFKSQKWLGPWYWESYSSISEVDNVRVFVSLTPFIVYSAFLLHDISTRFSSRSLLDNNVNVSSIFSRDRSQIHSFFFQFDLLWSSQIKHTSWHDLALRIRFPKADWW